MSGADEIKSVDSAEAQSVKFVTKESEYAKFIDKMFGDGKADFISSLDEHGTKIGPVSISIDKSKTDIFYNIHLMESCMFLVTEYKGNLNLLNSLDRKIFPITLMRRSDPAIVLQALEWVINNSNVEQLKQLVEVIRRMIVIRKKEADFEEECYGKMLLDLAEAQQVYVETILQYKNLNKN